MKKTKTSMLGVASLVVISALGMSTLSAPAFAAETGAAGDVQRAEQALGLGDDKVADSVAVLSDGQSTTIAGEAGNVEVSVGNAELSEVSYTADKLTSDTVRMAAVFDSADSSTASWTFEGDNEVTVLADGRAMVTDKAGELVAGLEAPWAVGSDGKQLATHYTAEGQTLTQHVTFTPEAAFPVVADPTIRSYPLYFTVLLTRSESITATSTVAACAVLFSKSPVPIMKALSIGCGVFAAFGTPQLAGGKCLKIHVAGKLPTLGTWWPTFTAC